MSEITLAPVEKPKAEKSLVEIFQDDINEYVAKYTSIHRGLPSGGGTWEQHYKARLAYAVEILRAEAVKRGRLTEEFLSCEKQNTRLFAEVERLQKELAELKGAAHV